MWLSWVAPEENHNRGMDVPLESRAKSVSLAEPSLDLHAAAQRLGLSPDSLRREREQITATLVGCITLLAATLNRADFWCQLWTCAVTGIVGGKHVGRNPPPASFT